MEVSSGSVSSGTLSSSELARGLYMIFDVAWLNSPIILGEAVWVRVGAGGGVYQGGSRQQAAGEYMGVSAACGNADAANGGGRVGGVRRRVCGRASEANRDGGEQEGWWQERGERRSARADAGRRPFGAALARSQPPRASQIAVTHTPPSADLRPSERRRGAAG